MSSPTLPATHIPSFDDALNALLTVVVLAGLLVASCGTGAVDQPRLASDVVIRDVTFDSKALDREVTYRAILPASIRPGQSLQVVYLLHGARGGFRDWSNDSDVARFASLGLLLVMPDGASSYYVNAAVPSRDRYDDFLVDDLVADVEARFPVAAGRGHRAVVGVSMGGFAAVNLALRHPDRFAFAGALSPALDVPRRAFRLRRLGQSIHYRALFGPADASSRRENDPFVRVRSADPESLPYLFLTCGEQEGLLPVTREFAALLAAAHLRHELHTSKGGHDWTQWNSWLPTLFASLVAHLDRADQP